MAMTKELFKIVQWREREEILVSVLIETSRIKMTILKLNI